jgi:hypothetical protein
VIRSKKITQSAKGESCTVRIFGACNGNPETTVLAHLPSNQHGMGLKSSDLCAVFSCSGCHDVIDRRVSIGEEFETRREWYLLRAVIETHERMVERGILRVA